MKLTPDLEVLLDEPLMSLGERDHKGNGVGLTVRTRNCLEDAGIQTVRDLLNCCPEIEDECRRGPSGQCCWRRHLRSLSNFGEKTLVEVFEALEFQGFKKESKCGIAKRGKEK